MRIWLVFLDLFRTKKTSISEDELIVRSDEEQQRSTEMYESLRDELYKRQLSNTEAYDKAILSLSSAGLALSLSFIKFIVPLDEAVYLQLLKASWILFLFSIAITVISFLIGNKGISTQLENAEMYYIDKKAKAFNKPNIYKTINSACNLASGILFLVALTTVVSFVILNINQGDSIMSKNTKIPTNDSSGIPSMQKVRGSGPPKSSSNIPSMGEAPGTTTTSKGGNSGNASSGGETKK